MGLFSSMKVAQNPTLPIIPPPHHQHINISTSTSTSSSSSSSSPSSSTTSINRRRCGGVKAKVKVNVVGRKWKEYQGLENWDGLLDPLDDNLRNEILRYGHFVEAAYKSFDFDPCSPSYASCLHSKSSLLQRSGLPSTGYRVSKHLRATSGIRLPTWLLHNNNKNISNCSSWIGYVAVCQDKREISRLGRRDVVIALRGTGTGLEWLENLRASLTKLPEAGGMAMVESGFLSLYTSGRPSLQEMVREEIGRVVERYKEGEQPVSITVTGHSLGAALATLVGYDVKELLKRRAMVTVISFGGPRVGNRRFRQRLEKQGTKVLRIVNSEDLITKLPGFVLDHEKPGWIQNWAYSEVGRELRLSSRDSLHINGMNVATCHHLNTYLHLLAS